MKILILACLSPLALIGQALPVVNSITVHDTMCTFTVVDSISSVSTECVLISDGTILKRAVESPHVKGSLLGIGPILCILSRAGAAANLQCLADDDAASGPKLVLNGVLPSVTKLRKWWIFWN